MDEPISPGRLRALADDLGLTDRGSASRVGPPVGHRDRYESRFLRDDRRRHGRDVGDEDPSDDDIARTCEEHPA